MIRVAIVGGGLMGRLHALTLRAIPSVAVAGIVSRDTERSQALAAEVGVPTVSTLSELVRRGPVDAVTICTREDDHVAPTLEALAAGLHVFVEKPLALSADECEVLVEKRRSDRVLMVGHILRFDPRYVTGVERAHSGAVGEITSITTHRVAVPPSARILATAAALPWRIGVHEFDLIRWISGSRVVRVTARAVGDRLRRMGHDRPDAIHVEYELASGVFAHSEFGWTLGASAPLAIRAGATVSGTKGHIDIDGCEGGVRIYGEDGARAVETSLFPEMRGEVVGCLMNELLHFVRLADGSATPRLDLNDAIEAVRVAEAVQISVARGTSIDMSQVGGGLAHGRT